MGRIFHPWARFLVKILCLDLERELICVLPSSSSKDSEFIKHMDKTRINMPLSEYLTKQASHPYS